MYVHTYTHTHKITHNNLNKPSTNNYHQLLTSHLGESLTTSTSLKSCFTSSTTSISASFMLQNLFKSLFSTISVTDLLVERFQSHFPENLVKQMI